MKVKLELENKYYSSVKNTLEVLLPEIEWCNNGDKCNGLTVITELDLFKGIRVKSYIREEDNYMEEILDVEILEESYNQEDFFKRIKERIKLAIYKLLSVYLEKQLSPWGILIGVRPTKIVHYLLDRGFSYEKINQQFKDVYGVCEDKRELILNIVRVERRYFLSKEEFKQKASIYLGIPFCPTRCNYCSFASYSFEKNKKHIGRFLKALRYEIEQVGEITKNLGLAIDTIYIGGGTPTVLKAEQLDQVIKLLKSNFDIEELREFSVEAGRVDTIDYSKLKVLKENGVNRISINPQTLNQKTLDLIERKHTVEDVFQKFQLARNLDFDNINTDLIIGLPGEGIKEVQNTVEGILRLNPDNLTVHTMSIKRASNLNEDYVKYSLVSDDIIKEMMGIIKRLTKKLGLLPYYMYRQKNILGKLENVGYTKRDKESIYNILMMEERQMIIGLGGGAITKFIHSESLEVDRMVNPKFPIQYIDEIEERTIKKIGKLTSWF